MYIAHALFRQLQRQVDEAHGRVPPRALRGAAEADHLPYDII